jgi:hypothetical protein
MSVKRRTACELGVSQDLMHGAVDKGKTKAPLLPLRDETEILLKDCP